MHIGQYPGIAGLFCDTFSSSFPPHPESAVRDRRPIKKADTSRMNFSLRLPINFKNHKVSPRPIHLFQSLKNCGLCVAIDLCCHRCDCSVIRVLFRRILKLDSCSVPCRHICVTLNLSICPHTIGHPIIHEDIHQPYRGFRSFLRTLGASKPEMTSPHLPTSTTLRE